MTALDASRQQWFEAACSLIDEQRLGRLIRRLTELHSPTGAERNICEFLASHLSDAGLEARYQPVFSDSGNCIARLRGSGAGPSVLAYAPVDTHLDADPKLDVPWAAPKLRADMLPRALVQDDSVIGLGSSNPKSMVASVIEAVQCLMGAQIALTGDVIAAFCGGGMPWIATTRGNAGIGSGVKYMLSHGTTADCAVIIKTWDDIYYEHPGMAWFKITASGSMGYAGIPRGIPEFRSSIIPAAKLILELEQWLIEYPARHRSEQILPQGAISALRAGWPTKPAFPPAATEIYVDIRTTPDQRMSELEAEVEELIQSVSRRHTDIQATVELIVSQQGARTDPNHWIVGSALRAWQQTHGRPYPGAPPMSGISDAAAISSAGIPIVRIGYPFRSGEMLPQEFRDGLGGMGAVSPSDLVISIRQLIYILIDICTRTRSEVEQRASTPSISR